MAKVFTITEGLENLGALKTGGQGSVYKGKRIGEIFSAIKILPTPIYSETAEDKNFTAFQNEVQKLKKVNEDPNPNVVKILNSGITDSGNFPFIEMEYIEGPDLEELLMPPNPRVFSVKEVLKVADQLSQALAHCHKVDVRHGDIKSNNVKFNKHTGNYVLLDFGLAVMSDEQRRSSLRHAGAIEFMAPEQNEGQMLLQTDIYSFGVVLFELIAGRVPFPLNDKGETARNKIMLAHMESIPPDMIELRKQFLPETWSAQKKEQEMQVPTWLINTVYKCLEKKPADRFANGMALHEHIWQNTTHNISSTTSDDRLSFLEQENIKLRREKELLQQQLSQFQKGSNFISSNITNTTPTSPDVTTKKKASGRKTLAIIVIALVVAGAAFYAIATNMFGTGKKKVIGDYKVMTQRAYFYTEPDESTRRKAFAVQSGANESIHAFDQKNGFIYTEITNEKGQKSVGWLRKSDLLSNEEWVKRKKMPVVPQLSPKVVSELNTARYFLTNGKMVEALTIYNSLAAQNVPEAMYYYGKLALQNTNLNISCTEGFNLLKAAADKEYTPAKRTLGFLYSFADNKSMLQQGNYFDRCSYSLNLTKGSKLLMEATLEGDTTASRLLTVLNRNR